LLEIGSTKRYDRLGEIAMMPQFNSAELNHLLQIELTEGAYKSPEDALLAGLRVLRQNRDIRRNMAERLVSLSDGQAIILDDDEALGQFLDKIDAEVDAEASARSSDA
jgi:hypothetical protein